MKTLIFIAICFSLLTTCIYAADVEQEVNSISNEIVKSHITIEDKIHALRQYVHKVIKPPQAGDHISDEQSDILNNYYSKKGKARTNGNITSPEDYYLFRDDMRFHISTIDKIALGYGWCDDMAVIFMHLAQKQGIRTRYIQLSNKVRTASPHTIAEAWCGNRWVIVDPLFNLEFKDNKLVSRQEITDDLSVLRDSPSAKELVKTDGVRWQEDGWLSIYTYPPWAIAGEQEAINSYTQI